MMFIALDCLKFPTYWHGHSNKSDCGQLQTSNTTSNHGCHILYHFCSILHCILCHKIFFTTSIIKPLQYRSKDLRLQRTTNS